MIKVLLFDLARVLLFPKDSNYQEELNQLHKSLSSNPTYNFNGYFYLDEKIMDYLRSIKDKYQLYMFTSGAIQYADEIHSQLTEIFKKIYSAAEMGVSKKDPESYRTIAKDIGAEPNEILFIDDSEGNVAAAKEAGLKAFVYKELEELKMEISEIQ